ncbi:hypothetical protein CR165_21450 [Pseudoroseomonas aestuarii]|uniref:Integrase catalytic domain-containing protein n=1 Tax=Teichococcus aestuarii TaxID=568898 RepID=A0A2U1UYP0_9PROT|nr:hypothetical protein CR165_21450 [Pseudoroseomonas aestuarii]
MTEPDRQHLHHAIAQDEGYSCDGAGEDPRREIEAWTRHCNASRPHSALGHLTPQKFAAKAAQKGC